MRIILLNGPPRSGKDTAGQLIRANWVGHGRIELHSFAKELKERTHGLYGLGEVSHLYFENRKDLPAEEFLGHTPRQAYIWAATYLLEHHGTEILGKLLLQNLEQVLSKDLWQKRPLACVVITDSGFVAEAQPLLRRFEPECFDVIRLTRKGTEWNDNRGTVDLGPKIRHHDLTNDGTPSNLLTGLRRCLEGIIA